MSAEGIISIRGLGKRYGGGFVALRSIDLDIRRGEIFALLGPNGAGKTTLINAVCGIVNPTQGTILIKGHDAVSNISAVSSCGTSPINDRVLRNSVTAS